MPDSVTYEQFQKNLIVFGENGFDGIELCLDSFPLIIEGEICRKWVDILKKDFQRHNFFYTAHIGRGLDLRNIRDFNLHRQVLHSSIRICKELSCTLLVLHYELQSKDRKAEKQFFDAHREAAVFAGEMGITLGVENIEVENVEPVVAFVDRLDMENVKMVFDTGHTFLASNYFNFDFFEAVKMMLPYLGHVHLSDNTGRFEETRITDRPYYDSLPMGWRREFGMGDIHLAPYYGKIPFDSIFSFLKDYRGKYICEYTSPNYIPLNREIQENVRKKITEMALSPQIP